MMETKFRNALNGFNKSDVVTYLQNLSEINRNEVLALKNELRQALEANERLRRENTSLSLESAKARDQIQSLTRQIEESSAEMSNRELEFYRRAEAAERIASEKAAAIQAESEERSTAMIRDAATTAESVMRDAREASEKMVADAAARTAKAKDCTDYIQQKLQLMTEEFKELISSLE